MATEHKNILADGVHILHRWKVADQTELDAVAPTADEVDKVALKDDDGTYWRLVTHSPITWKKVGATASEIKTAYESNADTNALTDALLTLLTTKKVKDVTTDAVNDKLVITYTDDTVANLNINDIVTDVYVSGATLDATTNVLTLASTSGGADVTVDLSTFVNSDEIMNYYTKDSVYIKEEVDTKIEQAITAGQIDDTIEATTKSWSSEKTRNEIAKAMLLHEILYHE